MCVLVDMKYHTIFENRCRRNFHVAFIPKMPPMIMIYGIGMTHQGEVVISEHL